MEPSREHDDDGFMDLFSLHRNEAGMDFLSQPSWLDLNSEADDFPNQSSYQSNLQSPVLGVETADGRIGSGVLRCSYSSNPTRNRAAGDAIGNVSDPVGAPRSVTQRNRACQAGSMSDAAASRRGPRVSAAAAGSGKSRPDQGGDGLEDDEGPFGHDPSMNCSSGDEEDPTQHLRLL